MKIRYKRQNISNLLRNSFLGDGEWGIPFIKKQPVKLENLRLLSFQKTKFPDPENKDRTVHFFIWDSAFWEVYQFEVDNKKILTQYLQLFTPDFSVYPEMYPWRQMESVAHSRYCGALWQSWGLKVIATISWSVPASFEFCFDGVEEGAIVAVSAYSVKSDIQGWIAGFKEMCRRIKPEKVLCYGKPFPDAHRYTDILYLPHDCNAIRTERFRNIPGQLAFPFYTEKSILKGA